MPKNSIIAIDPGRDKCGIAVLSTEAEVLYRQVIATGELLQTINNCLHTYQIAAAVIGNGTTSREAQEKIRELYPHMELIAVDEYYTTQLARHEYWRTNPPQGWRRLLPTSMQVPPVPVDDFVAVILARKYLHEVREKI